MNNFKVGQQVKISTNPENTPLGEDMLDTMNNPTEILGTVVYIGPNDNILIHSKQLEEHRLGHNGNGHNTGKYKSPSEKGCWWVGASQIKPYHEQPSFDLDKLFKEENK